MNDSSRYIVAIVLAMVILFSWQILFPVEEPLTEINTASVESNFSSTELSQTNISKLTTKESCSSSRIIIENDRLEGSIDLCGANY
jgi:hypothetical protein